MKKIWLMILLAGYLTSAYGINLGEILKEATKKKPEETTQQEKTTAQGQGTKDINLFGKVSNEDEERIGREIAGNLLGAAPLVKDDTLQRYVNKVGRWVATQSDRPDLPWHFGVIDSTDINAFSAPGGYIFVTKGLYMKLNSEAELAGVLAHEIAHVMKKHHLKLLQKSQMIDIASQKIAGKLGKNEDAIKNLVGNGAEALARSLDKESEFEADRIAVVLAARAGYDPYGLPSVLQKIGEVGKNDSSVALLFKTHPLPDDRLTQLSEAMGDRLDRFSEGKTLEKRFYRLKP